jgi:hypothetical protein
VDRLGWAAGVSLLTYGLRIGIRVNRAEALAELPELLPPGWRSAASPVVDRLYSLRVGGSSSRSGIRHYHLVYAGGTRVARTLDLEEALRLLESDLHLHVAARARRRVFVHAGVVGWRGQAILLPGRTYTGKTTLVAALVRAGATYYSDEYAVLDAGGRVHPYPRPLSHRAEENGPPSRLSVEALGGRVGRAPLPVGQVVLSEYRPGARWRPRPLSTGQAVLAVLANTVPARRRPAAAIAALQQALSGARAVRGTRGEAEEMVEAVLAGGLGIRAPGAREAHAGR